MKTPKTMAINGRRYIKKDYLVGLMVRERRIVRKHLQSEDWRYDWPELREYEKILTELLYMIRKI